MKNKKEIPFLLLLCFLMLGPFFFLIRIPQRLGTIRSVASFDTRGLADSYCWSMKHGWQSAEGTAKYRISFHGDTILTLWCKVKPDCFCPDSVAVYYKELDSVIHGEYSALNEGMKERVVPFMEKYRVHYYSCYPSGSVRCRVWLKGMVQWVDLYNYKLDSLWSPSVKEWRLPSGWVISFMPSTEWEVYNCHAER